MTRTRLSHVIACSLAILAFSSEAKVTAADDDDLAFKPYADAAAVTPGANPLPASPATAGTYAIAANGEAVQPVAVPAVQAAAASIAPQQTDAVAPAPVAASGKPLNLRLPSRLPASPYASSSDPEAVRTRAPAATADDEEHLRIYLSDMVDTAMSLSPDLREASANASAALSDVDQIKGQRMPQVGISADSSNYQFGAHSNNDREHRPGAILRVTTPLYDFGALSNNIKSYRHSAEARNDAWEQERISVAYETIASLLSLARHEEGLRAADRYVDRMRELVTMLSEIAEVDPGRGSEVVQARSKLLQAESARDQILALKQEDKSTLNKLVGEDVEIPAQLRWDWTPLSLDSALETLPEHPGIQQMQHEMEAAQSTAAAVRAARMPKFNWVVSRDSDKDFYGRSQPWNTAVEMEWKAYQGGSAAAAGRAASQRASAAEQRMEAFRRESEYRVRNYIIQRDLARDRVNDYNELLVESDRVRKMFYDQWYHLGKRTLLDVLIAENEFYSQQAAAINTLYDSRAADVRIRAETSELLEWLRPTGGNEEAKPQ